MFPFSVILEKALSFDIFSNMLSLLLQIHLICLEHSLAFLRLIGTVYFKKNSTGFDSPSPEVHYEKFTSNSTDSSQVTIRQQHINWINNIRETSLEAYLLDSTYVATG
jgi:hypothetical protein